MKGCNSYLLSGSVFLNSYDHSWHRLLVDLQGLRGRDYQGAREKSVSKHLTCVVTSGHQGRQPEAPMKGQVHSQGPRVPLQAERTPVS